MISEKIKMVGFAKFTLYDKDGNVKFDLTKQNMIVTSGINWFVSRMYSNVSPTMTHIAVGSGNNAPVPANTALQSEIDRQLMSPAGGSVNGQTITYSVSFGPNVGTGLIAEAGVFNASTAGTMLSRIVFTPFTKAIEDTLTIEWSFTQG